MTREYAPGGLATDPLSAVEGFFQQEALRYRKALIEIEETTPKGIAGLEARFPSSVWSVAKSALDAGDEAAG